MISFLHPRYHQKTIGDILKNVQKVNASFLMTFKAENEAENEKKIT